MDEVAKAVEECARAAKLAAPSLAAASAQAVDAALSGMAERLLAHRDEILEANRADVERAKADGMSAGLLDRLTITPERLTGMAEQLRLLAGAPHQERSVDVSTLDGGLRLVERRRPVGVIGANYEARPNVTVDVASQLVKSRNAGVLRTGSAALGSAQRLREVVIAPALAEAGIDADCVQLVPRVEREAASALVRLPGLVPLVILRGSGDSTRALATEAAVHGVRTLAHADGGGVLYVDRGADVTKARDLVYASLDRLGVCNRLNLLLIHEDIHDDAWPAISDALAERGVTPSLAPHEHPIGYEWALDSDREATVTVAKVGSLTDAVEIANERTSGLAAGITTEDESAADAFFDGYTGTGVFWNAPTRLLDGFKLLAVPETGINLDKVPGPRGPVTYTDLYVRQYAVLPA
ncbi:gamma-glutamyl phosphate reductase [Amycolatopsis mediterranei S699]|uniref:Gamma-glutamyl phosphate reductase n=3 Tax=Amycolatopsis mediterranei TaxID=33910 RepID=A0A0H3DF09_AMYMU|nr:aldehyde dehydrogenase family protein [Amycolatopsis mediterranei]ADJ48792.1 gamma-glutamyl phosphate reductase [Amycolatopsis mediterranei U32]AEK45732.1 gamma-glutamyl phosphate reductase [Amycolatopsis mediterranei S699]AFO80501.1 gamma-glutamyl phosphate reductase [Amycolatopsis mediterranei S699]AGT87629.1 gamma-glutamyl phosphate reductase [Amycolatopsis mediterranei RB]KDO04009.1 gamma-glutamyl phosphate reductase [Amycolatopsis mediterranei]